MPPPHTLQQTDTPAPAEAVAPLMRGIAVLRRLTDEGGTMSPSAIERATGLARSSVDRITATLARMEYVRVDGRDITLAPRLMELGNAYLSALRLPSLLGGHADALADELDESVSLAVGDGDGIRFVHQATRRRAMSLSFRIGDLLPAERTAPGPLLAMRLGCPGVAAVAGATGHGSEGPGLRRRSPAFASGREGVRRTCGASAPRRLGPRRPADRARPRRPRRAGPLPRRPRGLPRQRRESHQPAHRGRPA